MNYYSTNGKSISETLKEVVIKGLAPDKGLYMPECIPMIDGKIIAQMKDMSFGEIANIVSEAFFGDDVDAEALKEMTNDTLRFETPAVRVHDNVYALELFHGPTLAFKDVGARFMARMLRYFISGSHDGRKDIHVLVATSGDTGSAVANGFLGVEGVNVFVLYPKGKVSRIQECQFTTLGSNITALEIDGTFDDCQALVKQAFLDKDLNEELLLASANSINVARFLPQSFYYFNVFAQLDRINKASELVIAVPSGNFGNLTAGLFAWKMGLPVKRFIAANNQNDVFFEYLNTAKFNPRPSVETYANAMDVGNPSNFARILDLFDNDHGKITGIVSGFRCTNGKIAEMMRKVYGLYGYVPDPHGACGYASLEDYGLTSAETGVFLETAHPAKFKDTVDRIIGIDIEIPSKLQAFMNGEKQSVALGKGFEEFKAMLSRKLNI